MIYQSHFLKKVMENSESAVVPDLWSMEGVRSNGHHKKSIGLIIP